MTDKTNLEIMQELGLLAAIDYEKPKALEWPKCCGRPMNAIFGEPGLDDHWFCTNCSHLILREDVEYKLMDALEEFFSLNNIHGRMAVAMMMNLVCETYRRHSTKEMYCAYIDHCKDLWEIADAIDREQVK